jgi:hypothetical protein
MPHELPLLRLACALGATPDYAQPPWSRIAAGQRSGLDAEAARGR